MNKLTKAVILLAATLSCPGPAFAAERQGNPRDIHARGSDPVCVFFRLDGVATADPAVGGHPWFSLRRDHPHFAELFAILLTARANAGAPIYVTTSGSACNNAAVELISFL